MEGLRAGIGHVLEPPKQEGNMLKRRKWPMKGWHKVHAHTCGVLKKTRLALRGGKLDISSNKAFC